MQLPARATPLALIALIGVACGVGGGWLGVYAALPASAAWWLVAQQPQRLSGRIVFAASALLLGAVAVSGFQSNDLHRYLWEGRIQLAGMSPFALAPDHPTLEPFRDARFDAVLYPDLPSIYPPLAQLSFITTAALGGGEWAYRNGVILACLALVGMILLWLRATGREAGHAASFALSPVAILGAVGGHIDVLMCAALVGFVWAWEEGRFRTAGLLLGLAILSKTVAFLLVPWAVLRRPRAVLATVIPVVALGYAPYLEAGNVLGSLGTFARDFQFNPLGFALLSSVVGQHALAVATVLLAGWVAWWTLREHEPADAAVRLLIGLLLLAPVVHYWYLMWPLALLPGVRSVPLRSFVLAWAAAVAVSAPLYAATSRGLAAPNHLGLALIELMLPLLALVDSIRRGPPIRRLSCAAGTVSSPSFQR